MRFSEAIRLGAMLRPQAFGVFLADHGSCGLGAAYEATFGYPNQEVSKLHVYRALRERYPILSGAHQNIPSMECWITSLNDNLKCSREEIANRVHELENQVTRGLEKTSARGCAAADSILAI